MTQNINRLNRILPECKIFILNNFAPTLQYYDNFNCHLCGKQCLFAHWGIKLFNNGIAYHDIIDLYKDDILVCTLNSNKSTQMFFNDAPSFIDETINRRALIYNLFSYDDDTKKVLDEHNIILKRECKK